MTKQKTIPEQFGQMALGFAEIVHKIDVEKGQTKETKKKNVTDSENILQKS